MTPPHDFRRTISREEINALPIRRYEGEVRVVASGEEMARAAAELAGERVVGFDTETRPSFRVGESHPPALAQVATGRAVWIFQLQRVDCAAVLGGLLSSKVTVKAGVGLADDLRQLRKSFAFEPHAIVDLGAVARRHGMEKSGVRPLAAMLLGFRIPKGAKTTNWAARRLSPQQIAYAATDAWACRELYLRFEELGLL
ncbi:MAG TPA: 3'-5' exonuclease [Burkholderiales bacterium]